MTRRQFLNGIGYHLLFLIAGLPLVRTATAQSEDLSVLVRWVDWADARNGLQHHLNSVAFGMLDRRRETVLRLKTPAEWKARQAEVRKTLEKIVGPFPARTPLNARTLGTVRKDGFRIEKVVFESLPSFFVTGCLFVPDGISGKGPAILNVIGHTDISFRAPSYQQLILNLVEKKFIVLAIDPIGQGERLQYFDREKRRSQIGGSTAEHSYLGQQCFLSGGSAARYFTWDGIRALDYLVSRPEVDPNRIGVTGISGGGTQTSYIAALDERVAAAAPTCYITGFRRLLESIGPQDAEQNFNGGLAHGIDHADFLELRAPRATLVTATTRDFFSIQGAREMFAEARRAFETLGAAENLGLIEDDFGHGYTRKLREAIYAFFQKHLDNPGNPVDREMPDVSREDLTVTATGQLEDSLGGKTVFSLNLEDVSANLRRLETSRKDLASHLPRVRAAARTVSGYTAPKGISRHVFRGRHPRDGYHIEMHVMAGEGRTILPFLLFVPSKGARHPVVIYLHPGGKAAASAPGGEIEGFVRQGYAVLAPDLAGTGELGAVNQSASFLGTQTGRSVAGLRAADIVRCVQFSKSRPDLAGDSIAAVARKNSAIPLLHAAAFEESIARIALIEPLISFESVVSHRFYSIDPGDVVGNALTAYDLADLEASLAPRKLMLLDVQDHQSRTASPDVVENALRVVRRSYAERGAEGRLMIQFTAPAQTIDHILLPWLARQ